MIHQDHSFAEDFRTFLFLTLIEKIKIDKIFAFFGFHRLLSFNFKRILGLYIQLDNFFSIVWGSLWQKKKHLVVLVSTRSCSEALESTRKCSEELVSIRKSLEAIGSSRRRLEALGGTRKRSKELGRTQGYSEALGGACKHSEVRESARKNS